MDEEILDQSCDTYLSCLDERRNNTEDQRVFSGKLKILREAVHMESTMTQMGEGSLDRVTEISRMLKDVCDVGTQTGEEFKEVAVNMNAFVDIESTQFSEVLSGGMVVDMEKFERLLKTAFSAPHEPMADRVGSEFGVLISISLGFPEIGDESSSSSEESAPRPKRTKTKYERVTTEATKIEGVSARELAEANKGSQQKELDFLLTQLKKASKDYPEGINYYRFVIDPNSFAATVENMFYVSFLVRDKLVRLVVNKETGLPTISRVRKEETFDGAEGVQHITSIDRDTWTKLISRLNITAPFFQKQTPC